MDGAFSGTGPIGEDQALEMQVTGRGGVPDSVWAVSLNATAVGRISDGYETVFPCGGTAPNASNLDFVTGQVVPNSVLTKVGEGGKVCIFTSAAADFPVDVNGYMSG